jgi:hypothetical protein
MTAKELHIYISYFLERHKKRYIQKNIFCESRKKIHSHNEGKINKVNTLSKSHGKKQTKQNKTKQKTKHTPQ